MGESEGDSFLAVCHLEDCYLQNDLFLKHAVVHFRARGLVLVVL